MSTHLRGRWWLVLVGAMIVPVVSLGAAPAGAAGAHLTVPPWSGAPTSALTVNGTGFGASESVSVTWDGAPLASATTNGSGAFSTPATVPASAAPGAHTISALGQTSALNAVQTFTVRTSWWQFLGRPQGRANPVENVLSTSTVGTLAPTWATPTGAAVDSSAAVAQGLVVIGSRDGKLYALSEATGAVVWSVATGGAVTSSPAIVGSQVVVGSQNGHVESFNLLTGAPQWNRPTGAAVESSPIIAAGVVYVGSDDGSVYALRVADGSVVWSKPLGSPVRSSPGLAHAEVFVGADDGNVYALSAATGAIAWSVPTGGAVQSSPVVVSGTVYVGSASGTLYALRVPSGATRWTYDAGGPITSSPSVSGGVVYFGSPGGTLDALSSTSGARLWRATLTAAASSSPFTANGVVYAGASNGSLAAFAATGCGGSTCAPLWTGSVGTALASSPVVVDGSLIVGSGDDQVHLLSLAVTGPAVDWPAFLNGASHSSYNPAATAFTPTNASSLQLVWRWVPDVATMRGQPNTSLTPSPTVVDHRVYIGANTGVFYALDDRTGTVIWKRFLGFQPGITCPRSGFDSTATVVPDPSTGQLTVYVAAPDGYLYALSAATGATMWRSVVAIPSTTTNDYFNWSSPTVANNKIYVGISSGCDNPLVPAGEKAYDQATGALIASYSSLPPGKKGASIWSSAAVTSEGDVIVTTGNAAGGKLIADGQSIVRLDGSTLAKLDAYQVPVVDNDADFGGSPTVFNAVIGGTNTEMVGACNKDGVYYAFDVHHLSAGPVWSRLVGTPYDALPGDSQCDGAAIWDGSRLFVAGNDTTIDGTTYDGGIRQLDPATGAVIWETGLPGNVVGSPTLDGRGVIGVPTFDTQGGVNNAWLINASTGAVLTPVDTMGKMGFASPVFADNLVLVATWGKGLFAYHPKPGLP